MGFNSDGIDNTLPSTNAASNIIHQGREKLPSSGLGIPHTCSEITKRTDADDSHGP